KVGGGEVKIDGNSLAEGVFFIKMPKEKINGVKTEVSIGVYNGDELVEEVTTKFLGPASFGN
ncbi:MAG: cytochrome c oxidase accessory protein CcoG, partial [Bacteroidota bacterium]